MNIYKTHLECSVTHISMLMKKVMQNRINLNLFTQIRYGMHYLCKLTCFLDMTARTFGRASFYNGALVSHVRLVTADQLVFGKEATNVFNDRCILVRWEAHSTFQSQSCNKNKIYNSF